MPFCLSWLMYFQFFAVSWQLYQKVYFAWKCKCLLYIAVSQIIHETVMSIYSDKLAHVQIVINCRYSVAQLCTLEDTLAYISGMLFIDDNMLNNKNCIVIVPKCSGRGISQIFLGNIQFPGNGIRERRPLVSASSFGKIELDY